MYPKLRETIQSIQNFETISLERKAVLQPFINFIQAAINQRKTVNLNFICTHNSRRSHLSQIWAQCAAFYYDIPSVYCYSGGTEATAMFPKIVDILQHQGFHISNLANRNNPIYSVKMDDDKLPIIGFSKEYNDPFNPSRNFAAIMTCSQADENCPIVIGADIRLAVRYDDPKISDNTPQQHEIYLSRSLQIASEMFYVFSKIVK